MRSLIIENQKMSVRWLKGRLKHWLGYAGIDLTKNMFYDRLTQRIMAQTIQPGTTCIDVGSHEGEVLAQMIALGGATGTYYAFEPMPYYYQKLTQKFGQQAIIYPYALSDAHDQTVFHCVRNAPAYSGLKKRSYGSLTPDIQEIVVETRPLDELIPDDVDICFMKIDVEGAELLVMEGARKLIQRCHPVIVFEFGLGASDHYDSGPEKLYDLLIGACGMQVSTMDGYLKTCDPLSLDELTALYATNSEYYFVAHK